MPRAFELKYHQEVELFEKENDVSYITTAERIGLERGILIGELRGEGRLCLYLLEERFGMVPEAYRNRVQTADAEAIQRWSGKIYKVNSIESVFN